MIPKTDVKSGLLVENAICNFLRRFRYALLGTYFLYKIPHSFFALGEKSHAVSCFFLGVQKRFTNSGWPAKQRSSGWDPSTYPSKSVCLSQFWVLRRLLLLSESGQCGYRMYLYHQGNEQTTGSSVEAATRPWLISNLPLPPYHLILQ